MRLVLLTVSAVLVCGSFSAQAKMYKWVDENGQMHFGDRIPTEYQRKAHEELNDSGIVMKRKGPEKTAEQKREEKRLEKKREKMLQAEKIKQQRDRVLLDTYTTERDLIVARDSRLDAVGSQINLAETIVRDSNKKIQSLEKQVAAIKASDRAVPVYLYKQIESHQQQIAVQNKVKAGHEKRRDDISTQFKDYIDRFKVLKAEQKAKRDKLTAERLLDQ